MTAELIYDLSDLMARMGPDATERDGERMRDVLIERGWLTWADDRAGGELIELSEDRWLDALRVALECEWFHKCHNPSVATVEHPTLGDVEICQGHLVWLTSDYSPTKMVPPMAARRRGVAR